MMSNQVFVKVFDPCTEEVSWRAVSRASVDGMDVETIEMAKKPMYPPKGGKPKPGSKGARKGC